MHIYYGEADRPFKESNRTVSLISWGYSIRKTEDCLTIRKNGRKDWALFYCENGKITFKDKIITSGQFWIYAPNEPQYYKVCASDNTKYYYIHFTGSDIKTLFDSINIKSGPVYPKEDFSELMTAIGASYGKSDQLSLLKCEYLVLRLFYKLGTESVAQPKFPAIKKVTEEMSVSYKENYDIEKYAAIACLSTSRFNHLFKEIQGISPKSYFINLKIESACRLLEMSDLSVDEIAKNVGYTDVFGFSKIFKSRCGLSPTAYRKCYKKE